MSYKGGEFYGVLRFCVVCGVKDGKVKTSVGKDYNYVLVGSGSSKYLWVLSRFPKVPEDILNRILAETVRRGYPTDKLIWVPQN